ncbi:MAG TPA: hypothetical protein VGB55_11450, partial [Tepidisphaeraceae bacterium]
QALNALPDPVAVAFRVIPVRRNSHELVVACGKPLDDSEKAQVQKYCKLTVLFAHGRADQVEAAIERYYGSKSSRNEAA